MIIGAKAAASQILDENLAYLLKYDSTYGRLENSVEVVSKDTIEINGQSVKVYNYTNIEDVPWYDNSLDIVIDSSGVSENDKRISVHENKFGHYIVTTEPGDHIKSIVCGVNEETIDSCIFDQSRISLTDYVYLPPLLLNLMLNQELH